MSGNLNVLFKQRLAKIKSEIFRREKLLQDGLASGETASILRRSIIEIDALKTHQLLLERSCYLMDKEDAVESHKPVGGAFQYK